MRAHHHRRFLVGIGIMCVALTGLSACSSANGTNSEQSSQPGSSPSGSSQAGATATGAPAGESSAAAGQQLDTLQPGVIKVAIEPYAPYTAMQNGKMVGLDADILNAAAAKLGLKVEPQVTDFKGMLGGVQSHRVDISIGGIAWSVDRQKAGLFTDPVYYSPPAMAVKPGETIKTVADLQGKAIGTVEGYIWVKAIQEIPGAKLHAYPTATAVLDDLAAGRIDVAFLDPLLLIAAQKAGKNVQIEYLQPPSAADVAKHANYTAFQPYMVAFYIPKQEPKLEKALDTQIRAMYTDGQLSSLITKYGGDPEQFLKPSPDFAKERRGVDRPESWQPPSM